MKQNGKIEILGKKLRDLRKKHYFTQGEVASGAGVSEVRIRKIEGTDVAGIYPSTLRALAELFKMKPEELLLELSATKIEEPGLTLSTPVPVPDIPTFDLAVAAGPWAEVAEMGEVQGNRGLADGRFRINIGGDSMEPDYPRAAMVEFRSVRWSETPLVEGEDYYVQVDQHATFKRLEKAGTFELVFRAVNRKKYPKAISVATAEVVQMARAEYIITRVKKK